MENQGKIILQLIEDLNIDFERGDPVKYFSSLSKLFMGLTLPFVKNSEKAIYLKNVFTLWNTVIDDAIDRHRSRLELDSSINFLISGTEETEAKSVPLLKIMLKDMGRYLEIAKQDLLELLVGLNAEFLMNQNMQFATLSLYTNQSTNTTSIHYLLDTDLALSKSELSTEELSNLRAAYRQFAIAIKYSSDLGSFEREFTNEQNLNYLLIKLIQEGDFSATELFSVSLDQVKSKAEPYFEELRELVRTKFQKGLALLNKVSTLETSSFSKAISGIIVQNSQEEDLFF